ncbi:MAG TPA: type I 3-dehydroquinate dehydratase [Thermoplasmata archaeon]|nr:type I 3-dehydroquinate dehydratase [Thermoplasmata archaeon]
MTGARPAIVVSLPARSVAEAVPQIAEARAAGADAAEVRLDRWTTEERRRLGELFPAALPLIATLRSAQEGGGGPNSGPERAPLLLGFAGLPFRWIDLELGRDDALVDRLPPTETLGRVVSRHLRADEASEWPLRWLELSNVRGVGKLIVPASVPVALGEILPRLLDPRDEPVVVHTTGPSGPLLRAFARRLGSPLVFAALPEGGGRAPVEPSQIPVDRLRRYLEASGEAPLFAVAGRPVAHSQSPAIHSTWMEAEGRAGLYVPLEFASDDEFLESIPLLAANGFRGLNVTHPLKGAAFESATDSGAGATACGTANCLTFRDGEVLAENTDLIAVLRRLEELRAAGAWNGRSITVLGAGGAARATLAAARALSVPVTVVARRPAAAAELAQAFGAASGPSTVSDPGALVVHASSAGRETSGTLDPSLAAAMRGSSLVLDWVYRPAESSVRAAATTAGASYEDGWRLFVYQAAASYALWWGEEPRSELVGRAITEGACVG